jgi:hypothetical protein
VTSRVRVVNAFTHDIDELVGSLEMYESLDRSGCPSSVAQRAWLFADQNFRLVCVILRADRTWVARDSPVRLGRCKFGIYVYGCTILTIRA